MNHAALVGIGVVIGSVGTKVILSDAAKKVYVKGLVAGMRVRDGVSEVVEEAKAQFDDMCAEAEYEREQQREAEDANVKIAGTKTGSKQAKASAKTASAKASKASKTSTAKKTSSSKK